MTGQVLSIALWIKAVLVYSISFEKESYIHQLKPTIMEAEALNFDSYIDDESIETLKELSVNSKFLPIY